MRREREQVARHGARSELAFGARRQYPATLAMAWKFSSGAGGSRALEAKQSLLRCFSRKRCGCFPRKKPVQLLSRVSWELKEKIGRPGVSSSSVDVDKFGGHWIVAEPDELVEPAGS